MLVGGGGVQVLYCWHFLFLLSFPLFLLGLCSICFMILHLIIALFVWDYQINYFIIISKQMEVIERAT